jgi:hypothetical protein
MAKPKSKSPAVETTTAPAEVFKTGLGETIEEVEAKCTKALKEFLAIVKKGEKAPLNDLLEAAFQWALPEKRARKLRKKIAGK